MVNDLVENRALCELYPLKQNDCNEMASAYKQAQDMHALQDYIDAQFGGPGKGFLRIVTSPAEARAGHQRRASWPWCSAWRTPRSSTAGSSTASPKCDAAQIDRELDELDAARRAVAVPGAQVRQRARRHAIRQRDDRRARQRGQQVRHGPVLGRADHCDAADHDNEPTNPTGADWPRPSPLFGPVLIQPLLSGQLPVYPPGAAVQPAGADRPGRAPDPLDDAPRHDHRDRPHEREGAQRRSRSSRPRSYSRRHLEPQLGRRRQPEADPAASAAWSGPIAHEANEFVDDWREARANRDPRFFFGVGFGSDINGLHAQPVPRAERRAEPGASTRSGRSTAGA